MSLQTYPIPGGQRQENTHTIYSSGPRNYLLEYDSALVLTARTLGQSS